MKTLAKIRFFFRLTLFSAAFFSCHPEEDLPKETILTYRNHQFIYDNDNKLNGLILQVDFQDGDGNIGLYDVEIGNPPYQGKYAHNFFVNVFDKTSENHYDTLQFVNDTGTVQNLVYPYTIGVLSDIPNTSVKGTLDVYIDSLSIRGLQSPKGSKNGILQFQMCLYDRNLTPSNTVVSPDIKIR